MNKLFPTVLLLVAVAAVGAPVPVPPLSPDFAWMSGGWCARDDLEFVEEYWLPSRGALMLGVRRSFTEGRPAKFEFMRIEIVDGAFTFISQPQGGALTAFKLVKRDTYSAHFKNDESDVPRVIDFSREGLMLYSRVGNPVGDPFISGRGASYEYRPCRPTDQRLSAG